MARCETCGNEYDKTFTVKMNGGSHTFDSFECAIERLAPRCSRCGCKVIGHGVEADEQIYCSGHCAHRDGQSGIRDRA